MAETVKDPVCGMTIDKDKAVVTAQYKGQTYYLCGAACKKQFEKNPEKYVGASPKPGGCH